VAFDGEGRVVESVGGWEDYLRQRRVGSGDGAFGAKGAKGAGGKGSAANGAAIPRRERERRLSYKEQRELEALPERIAALEEEQQRLKEEAASADFYKSPADHIHAVLARIDAVDVELHATLERWMELEALQ
jgi:ATP-binding cassette subfamily F protein uup